MPLKLSLYHWIIDDSIKFLFEHPKIFYFFYIFKLRLLCTTRKERNNTMGSKDFINSLHMQGYRTRTWELCFSWQPRAGAEEEFISIKFANICSQFTTTVSINQKTKIGDFSCVFHYFQLMYNASFLDQPIRFICSFYW